MQDLKTTVATWFGQLIIPAHGIIVPLLHTADDARRLVQYAKFPPTGVRGFGSPFPMEKFGGQSQTEYLQQANESLVTIVQIETKEALENVSSPTATIVDMLTFIVEGQCHRQYPRYRRPLCRTL